MEFAECLQSRENILAFVNKYGVVSPLLIGAYEGDYDGEDICFPTTVREFEGEAERMESLALAWHRSRALKNYTGVAYQFEKRHRNWNLVDVRLTPNVHPAELPRLSLECPGISEAMMIQFAMAITSNLQIQKCSVCPTWFPYGTGTGRRKSSQYCSDKCRNAAHRKRKADSA